jgi:hypothetical protein
MLKDEVKPRIEPACFGTPQWDGGLDPHPPGPIPHEREPEQRRLPTASREQGPEPRPGPFAQRRVLGQDGIKRSLPGPLSTSPFPRHAHKLAQIWADRERLTRTGPGW